AASDPLVPVPSWRDVRARSILPYGIVNPVPLYHYLLYAWIHVVPITEWWLRLPSLLAGLACVAGLYFLCRERLGNELALMAALFAALDPLQTMMSVLARPYALGNFASLLSYFFLLRILQAPRPRQAVLAATGYGLALA